MKRLIPVLAALALASACAQTGGGDNATADVPSGCASVDVASSPEKLELLTQLAEEFNRSDAARDAEPCAFVRVNRVSSGVGLSLLSAGWTDEGRDGPRPVIWSPAARSAAGRQRSAFGRQRSAAAWLFHSFFYSCRCSFFIARSCRRPGNCWGGMTCAAITTFYTKR